jgi:hypothetical protein
VLREETVVLRTRVLPRYVRTTYFETAAPPLLAGAAHRSTTERWPADAARILGALGSVRGTTTALRAAGPAPAALTAPTVTVYARPLTSPVRVRLRADGAAGTLLTSVALE